MRAAEEARELLPGGLHVLGAWVRNSGGDDPHLALEGLSSVYNLLSKQLKVRALFSAALPAQPVSCRSLYAEVALLRKACQLWRQRFVWKQ